MTEKVVLKIKLTIVLNIEETETLTFTYDAPFQMSQRHSKFSMNQTEPFGKIMQLRPSAFCISICVL